ncbi:Dam family site-specific DNA-(adenine-N6)-methyltransferase [Escherichia coli]|nr:Dam family site-specific DNA-(adenine-N6)-methyltransferase [Escherichia coli]
MSTILKWAGNKTAIMSELKKHLPAGPRLVEPFAGSCAVMMETDYPSYLVADINPDLINLYKKVAADCESFISRARVLFEIANREVAYYNIRQEFNYSTEITDFMKAVYFLYLNRHGYRGLCRYNKSGHFNIPYGNYKNPYFPEKEIRAFAEKAQRATFICASFDETLAMLKAGDVVYCDPPYDGTFSGYHTDGFTEDDQYHLASVLEHRSSEGHPVIVSNSDTSLIRSLYRNFTHHYIKAKRSIGTRREKSWHNTTIGEVVKEIAARHKLKMALGKELSDKPVEHIDQTNESDGSFLMRLARQYGAIASVKNGNLLFIRQGQGKSATGKPLPVITITRKDGDSHRFTLADRGAYTGVIASWLHTREPAKKESTTVKRKRRTKKQKKEPEAKQGDYLVGTDENVLVLNRTYANRGNAERAAKMQWERLQRGVASFSLQLAEGRADLYTEMPVKVSGFKQPIDDAEWTITTLTHTVSPDNGFTTSLELEVRIDDFEME